MKTRQRFSTENVPRASSSTMIAAMALLFFVSLRVADARLRRLEEDEEEQEGDDALASFLNGELACVLGGMLGGYFSGCLANAIDLKVAGTKEEVPAPYKELVMLGIDPPRFPSGCNLRVRVHFKLTSLLSFLIPDSHGYADLVGAWDPASLMEMLVCVGSLRVTEIEMSNEPELIENYVEDHINGQLENKVRCYDLMGGGMVEEEDEEEEGDNDEPSFDDNGVEGNRTDDDVNTIDVDNEDEDEDLFMGLDDNATAWSLNETLYRFFVSP